ncbi:MAG: stage V sporulation protein AD [Firmicutes bacterium]|nr:stage V sporulation protein AD [Bacillota bacterium]
MTKKLGKQSFYFANPPVIISTGTVVGPFEANSPFKDDFDFIFDDNLAGQESFEKAERTLLLNACYTALNKINTPPENIEYFLAGDLLNQIISAGFSALKLEIPFLGIYGACSTAVEGLILASVMIDGGFCNLAMAATSSHNSSAERQYRYPTEYGNQRKPFSQWTVTGAGAAVVSVTGMGPVITHATVGKVTDLACKDPLNLGAAMAPAAADTIIRHFADTGRNPTDYDLILTGDLGKVGQELAIQWTAESGGFDLSMNYQDCGELIYDKVDERVHAGGSGCACAAIVAYGNIYRRLRAGELKKVLLVATGAMHSPTSFQQGENIPCIAHAISIEAR